MISTPNGNVLNSLMLDADHKHQWTIDSLSTLFTEFGFEMVDVGKCEYDFDFYFIGRKL